MIHIIYKPNLSKTCEAVRTGKLIYFNMFNTFKVWNSETTVKTENLSRKISKVGNVFAMLIIAMFMFSACDHDMYVNTNIILKTSSSVSKNNVRNGESVTLTVTVEEGTADKVSFYWDSTEIKTLTAPPYEVTYNLENESIGTHSFSYQAVYLKQEEGFAVLSTSGVYAIVVEE